MIMSLLTCTHAQRVPSPLWCGAYSRHSSPLPCSYARTTQYGDDAQTMRITTWNINGLRTLRQYRPWYALKDWKACLDHLEADIICFQEVKLTRKALVADHRDMCIPDGYEAYYSLHPTKGYSGVATFVKSDVCDVRKAEMGLTGELVADRLDEARSIGGYPDERAPESPLYDQIDAEGRAVVVDCGMFVLFNLYCPNETDEGRRDYKMTYYHTLAERVENLLSRGREVIIVGDMNIAHLPIDHCEGVNQRTRQEHLDIHPARQWLDQFLTPDGAFHDVTRRFHPARKFMYTCWDTVKDTRPANYGVRIDYTLVSRGLLKWIRNADIQPNIYGSDHCPVFVDLYDEIQDDDGTTLYLRDKLKADVSQTKRKAPALATCNWPEFAGRRIQSFFQPRSNTPAVKPETPPIATQKPTPSPMLTPNEQRLEDSSAAAESQASVEPFTKTASQASGSTDFLKEARGVERRPSDKTVKESVKSQSQKVKPPGQRNLRSFFQSPVKDDATPPSKVAEDPLEDDEVVEGTHQRLPPEGGAATMSEEQASIASTSLPQDVLREVEDDGTQSADRVTSALAWGSIFAPKQAPLCYVHREPARPWTVNKPGPNHGRKFWMCARPVGSGGTGRSEDNIPYRCSYWKWDSDVRTRAVRLDRDPDGSARSFHEVAGRAPRLASGETRGMEKRENRAPHKSVSKRSKQE